MVRVAGSAASVAGSEAGTGEAGATGEVAHAAMASMAPKRGRAERNRMARLLDPNCDKYTSLGVPGPPRSVIGLKIRQPLAIARQIAPA